MGPPGGGLAEAPAAPDDLHTCTPLLLENWQDGDAIAPGAAVEQVPSRRVSKGAAARELACANSGPAHTDEGRSLEA